MLTFKKMKFHDALSEVVFFAVVEEDNFVRVKKAVAKILKTKVIAVTKNSPPKLLKFPVTARRTILETDELAKFRDEVAQVLNLIPIEVDQAKIKVGGA